MLRKIALVAVIILGFTAAQVSAQKATITFDKKSHDFGQIREDGGNAVHVFEFTNTGNATLLVQRVNASCGCTTPEWTQTPVEPGKKGKITASFNPVGQSPNFSKQIYVYSNASNEMETLTISGKIIKRGSSAQSAQQNMANNYPIDMGGQLKLNMKVAQFGNINKTETQMRTINVLNSSSSTVNVSFADVPSYMQVSINPSSLKANETGLVTINVNGAKATEWGPINESFYVVLNGKRSNTDAFKINTQVNIIEDFSKMTAAQKRTAPIIEVKSYNLYMGTIKQGSRVRGKVAVKNVGTSHLELRRMINNNSDIVISPMRMSIKGGHTENLKIEIDSKFLPKGEYKKAFTIQTNDPVNTYVTFTLSYKVI